MTNQDWQSYAIKLEHAIRRHRDLHGNDIELYSVLPEGYNQNYPSKKSKKIEKLEQSKLSDSHMKATPPVISAPDWLIERMQKLAALPPPTLEEVETSFRASEATKIEELEKEKNIRIFENSSTKQKPI